MVSSSVPVATTIRINTSVPRIQRLDGDAIGKNHGNPYTQQDPGYRPHGDVGERVEVSPDEINHAVSPVSGNSRERLVSGQELWPAWSQILVFLSRRRRVAAPRVTFLGASGALGSREMQIARTHYIDVER